MLIPPLGLWPLLSLHQPPWPTYSDKSRATPVRTSRKCIPTGSKSTATLYHRHRLPRLSTSSPHWAPQSPRSPASGRKSSTASGSTWHQHSPVFFRVLSLSPSIGSLITQPPPAPTRPSGTSNPRLWLHLGLISPCTEAAIQAEVTPL